MTKRSLTALSATVALLLAVGCGPDSDPSENNTTENNTTANNTVDNNTIVNNTAGENNTGGENNTTGQNNTTGENNTTGQNNTTVDCTPSETFFGQIANDKDVRHGGGVPTTDPITNDAGLQAVWDATPETEDEVNELDEALSVSEALVIATDFADRGNRVFWLQDANAVVSTFSPQDDPFVPPEDIKVGMQVSFDVTEVTNFRHSPSVTGMENFVIDSSGNDVSYTEATGQALSPDDWGTLVKVGGELSNPRLCDAEGGTRYCYDLTHDGQVTEFRVDIGNLQGVNTEQDLAGTCVTFLGPMGAFPGPLSDAPEVQLQPENYSWFWRDFN